MAGNTPVANGTLTLALGLSSPIQGRIVATSVVAPSPVVVPLDANGAVNFSIAANSEIEPSCSYNVTLKDSNGNQIWQTVWRIQPGGSTGAGNALDVGDLGYSLLGGPGDRLGHLPGGV